MALDVATITIGEDVLMGPSVQLLTPTHPMDPDTPLGWSGPCTTSDNVTTQGPLVRRWQA